METFNWSGSSWLNMLAGRCSHLVVVVAAVAVVVVAVRPFVLGSVWLLAFRLPRLGGLGGAVA